MSEDIVQLFIQFNEAQQKRPAIYARMQEAFDNRHQGCSHSYEEASKNITMEHIEASKAVINVAVAFESNPLTHRAGKLLRSLQLLEKEKLQKTAELYIMQQKYEDQKEDFDEFEEAQYERDLKLANKTLIKIVSQINELLDEIKEEEIHFLAL